VIVILSDWLFATAPNRVILNRVSWVQISSNKTEVRPSGMLQALSPLTRSLHVLLSWVSNQKSLLPFVEPISLECFALWHRGAQEGGVQEEREGLAVAITRSAEPFATCFV